MENKVNYLNIGCGNKFHKDWVNIDMVSNSPHVIEYNILTGLPFEANQFDMVYHSQVLEHIPKTDVTFFISECFRVLKPGGIIRIVVPNLENITEEYQKYLTLCKVEPNKLNEENYEWILLEMYDQTVRNHSGGLMAEYLQKKTLINETYVINRIGFVGKKIHQNYLERLGITSEKKQSYRNRLKEIGEKISRNLRYEKLRKRILTILLTKKELKNLQIGEFRRGGEIHYWMYDGYSLKKLLTTNGFINTSIMTPFDSAVPRWEKYELDVKEGNVFDPTSLFMEAQKPVIN